MQGLPLLELRRHPKEFAVEFDEAIERTQNAQNAAVV